VQNQTFQNIRQNFAKIRGTRSHLNPLTHSEEFGHDVVAEVAVSEGRIRPEEHQVGDHHGPEVPGTVGGRRAPRARGRGEPVLEREQRRDEEERNGWVGPSRHRSRRGDRQADGMGVRAASGFGRSLRRAWTMDGRLLACFFIYDDSAFAVTGS